MVQEAEASQQEQNRVNSRRETPMLTLLEETKICQKSETIGEHEILQVCAHSFFGEIF